MRACFRGLFSLTVVVAFATSLVFAGCSSGDDGGTSSTTLTGSASDGSGSGASGAGPFPVTISHRFGDTTVEGAAERVVTIGLTDQDSALAVGVVPVGTTEWFGEQPGAVWPWAVDELGDSPVPTVLSAVDGIDYEGVAALRPDLILAVYSGLADDEYAKLSAIAPTIAQPDEYPDWGVPWQDQTRIIGEALGHTAAAESLVSAMEADIESVRGEHPEFTDAQASMATVYDSKLSVYAPHDPRGRFLASLGFVEPAGLADLAGDGFSADVSMERIDLIDGAAVVWLINDRETDILKFESHPLYSELDVHTQGRDVFLEMNEPVGAATSFVTVLSLPTLLDGLVPLLADAVAGTAGSGAG